VFLSTHWWSKHPACQRCFYKPLRNCHPSQRVSTPPGARGKRPAAAARHSQSARVHTDSPPKTTFSYIFLCWAAHCSWLNPNVENPRSAGSTQMWPRQTKTGFGQNMTIGKKKSVWAEKILVEPAQPETRIFDKEDGCKDFKEIWWRRISWRQIFEDRNFNFVVRDFVLDFRCDFSRVLSRICAKLWICDAIFLKSIIKSRKSSIKSLNKSLRNGQIAASVFLNQNARNRPSSRMQFLSASFYVLGYYCTA